MSDTTKEVEKLEEVNAAVKDAAPGEATHLKNDAVDMGAPVVKPTDKNPDSASKAKQNTSDPALRKVLMTAVTLLEKAIKNLSHL